MFRIVYSTVGTDYNAKIIAKNLIESRLAACVNIIPNISSYYIWNDQLQNDNELIMIIKIIKDNTEAVINKIKEFHDAENPAIICFDITNGSQDFLNWIENISIIQK